MDSQDPSSVVMAHALPLLAGRALVIGWTAAMGNALEAGEEYRVWKLFEAALSVPIRMRIRLDPDTCHLASLLFSESIFASSHPTNWKERHVQAHMVCVVTSYEREGTPRTGSYGLRRRGEPQSHVLHY